MGLSTPPPTPGVSCYSPLLESPATPHSWSLLPLPVPPAIHPSLTCSNTNFVACHLLSSCTPLNFPAIPPCPFVGFFSSLPTCYFLLSSIFSPLTSLSLQVPSGLTSCSDMEHNSSLQQSSSKVGVSKSTDAK